jgi:Tol biopolymer transport system component
MRAAIKLALRPNFVLSVVMGMLSVVALVAVSGFAATPAEAEGGCPNEALRAENGSLVLPDCRAYERVTPAAKNGAEFNGGVYLSEPARVAFESLATFGGAEFTNLLGTSYEVARTSAGWVTHPLGAPATRFEGTDLTTPLYSLGAGGTNLLGLRTRGEPVDGENLYLRQGSSITEIGPDAPPSSLRGLPNQEGITTNENLGYSSFQLATPDLSHVAFELFSPGEHNYLWPFDQTGEGFLSSAYEYVGTGNTQPFLVGVSGGQGSSALISGCGTSLGSFGSQDLYNAMSSDGSVVYFTPWGEDEIGTCNSPIPAPAHTELYARVDGEKASAHSVAISEPSAADCSTCQTASPSLATFQGASEDGSKAFFLTEGELLPGNPGKNLYEYDFDGPAGARVTSVSHLASGAGAGVLGVTRISADGSHVYFVATAELTSEANSTGAHSMPGEPNLYVYDTGTGAVKFVATLASEDSELWKATDNERQAQTTPDGRYLLFTSIADLTPDDTSSVRQLFRYDATTGELQRVSVGQDGFNGDGNTNADPIALGPKYVFERHAFTQNGPSTRLISDDGSTIFFESTDGLTPKALNHEELPNHAGLFAENVYEWHNGEISLVSGGQDRTYIGTQIVSEQVSSVHLIGTDASGQDVLFTTSSPLVPADTDEGQDIYDARVDGGFADLSGFACESDACQGPPSAPPNAADATSATFAGPGNLPPSPAPTPKAAAPTPKTAAQARAQKLARALKACRGKKSKQKRKLCEGQARKRYGPPKPHARSKSRKGGK